MMQLHGTRIRLIEMLIDDRSVGQWNRNRSPGEARDRSVLVLGKEFRDETGRWINGGAEKMEPAEPERPKGTRKGRKRDYVRGK